MAKRRPRRLSVDDPEVLRALVSPARIEILHCLAGVRRASVAELARLLGRAPSSLYHHLEVLAEHGLVAELAAPEGGGKAERRFESTAAEVGLAHERGDPERAAVIADAMAAAFRASERAFRAALVDGTGRVRGSGRDTMAARSKGWLDDASRAELLEHMEAITEIFHRRQGRTDGRLMTATVICSPATVKTQRRES